MKKLLALLCVIVVFFNIVNAALADLSYNSDPAEGGTVIKAETQTTDSEGRAMRVYTASPNSGYSFDYWVLGGEARPELPASHDFFDDNRVLTAKFKKDTYILTTSVSPEAGGSISVSGGNPHEYGDTVTLTVSTNLGYNFVGWEGALTGTSTTQTITMYSDLSVTAKFEAAKYSVNASASPDGAGVVNGSVPNLDYGSTASVSAAPTTGYKFLGWYEGETKVSSDALYSFVVTASRTLVAKFEQESSAGTGTGTGEGTGTGTGTGSGTGTGTDTGNTTVEPQESGETVKVQVFAYPADAGTTTSGGVFAKNSTISLAAFPNSGYVFDKWSIGEEFITKNPCTYTVTKDITVYANFKKEASTYYTITYKPGPHGIGGEAQRKWMAGYPAWLEDQLFERSGYTQTGWTLTPDGSKLYDLNQNITLTGDVTLYPSWHYTSVPLYLTVRVSGSGSVLLNNSVVPDGWLGRLDPNESFTFSFIPAANNYVYSLLFAGWYRNLDYNGRLTISYDMMKGNNQSLNVRFNSVYASPKTGDDSNVALWAALGILAAGGLGAILFISKRKK